MGFFVGLLNTSFLAFKFYESVKGFKSYEGYNEYNGVELEYNSLQVRFIKKQIYRSNRIFRSSIDWTKKNSIL